MNPNKLSRLFPNASKSFQKLNSDSVTALSANYKESSERLQLDGSLPRKTKSSIRLKIIFTIYAIKPADWDGYDIKSMQDLVVKSGILPGDDWFTLRGEVISEKVDEESQEKTVIEIIQL